MYYYFYCSLLIFVIVVVVVVLFNLHEASSNEPLSEPMGQKALQLQEAH